MEYLGTIIKCPYKFLFGVSCPGCGMTRAWLSVFKLDVIGAFYYHPLFLLVPATLIVLLIKDKISQKLYKGITITFVSLLIIVYLFRMFDPLCSVVTFEPKEGFIYKSMEYLGGKLNVLSKLW